MDILSEVLRVVRLSGAIHFCAEFTHPWAILTPPPDMVASHLARAPRQWWQTATNHLVREATKPGPGNGAVLARLSELLFMQVLRWQLIYISNGHNGWFAGLNDAHVGRALAFLHADPAGAWTVEGLAQKSGMSRAALARRFVELVGVSPMQYLAGWRMHLARRLLRETNISVGELAARVGYESEAAFSRAFRRSVGVPPATWRDVNVSAPEH